MLGWSKVLMLWAYFDESGEDAPQAEGGGLKKFTIGGCIATFEAWEGLSLYWSDAIAKMGIPMFHMSDFGSQDAVLFKDWTKQQKEDRLNVLLGIIGSAKPHCYGFTNIIRQGDSTSSIYERCAQDVLLKLGIYDEKVAIVFAHHPEFGRHAEFVDLLLKYGMGKQIRSCTTAYPIDTCPLQAADIVAYEMSRQEREESCLRKMRYPLKTLIELGCTFNFSASAN